MRRVFQQELLEVRERLVEISLLVASSIQSATRAFNDPDLELAESVIAGDDEIDALVAGLDELVVDILARQQPVARDLRILVSALRISSSLERMGDLGEHIALIARYRHPEHAVPAPLRPTFARMGELDVRLAEKLSVLLRDEDVELAAEMGRDDDLIDELHASVFDTLLRDDWEGTPEDTVDATLASRYHERFADHAVSIARKVHYLATGERPPL